MFFTEEESGREEQEDDKHDDDFGLVLARFGPYFVEEIPASENFDEIPEDDDRGNGITYGVAYFADFHEFYKETGRPHEAAEGDEGRDGVPVAQNLVVVGKHQYQIAGPQQDIGLDKGGKRVVAVYRVQRLFVAVDVQHLLYPAEKDTAGTGAEYVEHEDNGQETYRRHHDEVFGFGNDFAVFHGGSYVVAAGKVDEGKLYPPGPCHETADEAGKGGSVFVFDVEAPDSQSGAQESQYEGRGGEIGFS